MIEQSWSRQEEQNRQAVLRYPPRHRCLLFLVCCFFCGHSGTELASLQVYLQCLPTPLLAITDDLRELIYKHDVHADLRARSLWEAWSHDPAARSVLTVLLPRLRHPEGRLWSTARPFIPSRQIVYYLSLLTRRMVSHTFSCTTMKTKMCVRKGG
jgi:hypothetical protein